METISNGFVCLMGMGVVFVGLICIVILCKIMSAFCKDKQSSAPVPTQVPSPVAAPVSMAEPIPNKQELIAAICAVIAEEEGTDISGIRVLSFQKI